MKDAATRCREMLADRDASVHDLLGLAEEFQKALEFGLARKLLARAGEMAPDNLEISQQLALCTYKDNDLLPAVGFAQALTILERLGLRDRSRADAETLRLGGAVHKRKWEYSGQLEHLYEALSFYRAAYQQDPLKDQGYGGVNAAYILDILASRARAVEQRSGTQSTEAQALAQQARGLREQMVAALPPLADNDPQLKTRYWFAVTVAEVYFGLGQYADAAKWLSVAGDSKPTEWDKQTTFHQLVSIARLQGVEPPKNSDSESWHPAWQALTSLLGEVTECALPCYRGKVGLALSGGGFRASLFHLGVLARLAEMDVLRSVEVLSTVSGGSIVGAHYYLEVKKTLHALQDKGITREHYIEIVERVQRDFIAGVQKNLRMRALANFANNLKLIFSKSCTLSNRLGELYEAELFSRVQDGNANKAIRTMPGLLIQPSGEAPGFRPNFSNWRRRAKVPVLLLNATSLNTGHTWQFTARSMGEPPGLLGDEVDKNERCRRMNYEQAPKPEHQNYCLGYAVAASACVPGLFDPLVIEDLYQDRVVRLVDGGVHDNQGIAGLLNESCDLLLCSDASGQMDDTPEPAAGRLSVLMRSNTVLMDRVREAQVQDLAGRVDSKALEGLFFIHLKKDLSVPPLDWIHCQDPSPTLSDQPTFTPYGVDINLQRKLAGIRTDLDSFTEVEAHALMLSGYLMTEYEFRQLQKAYEKNGEPGTWGSFDIQAKREDWPFLQLEALIKEPEQSADPSRQDMGRQLDVASSLLLKVWKLERNLQRIAGISSVFVIAVLAWLIWAYWSTTVWNTSITVGGLVLILTMAAAGLMVPVLRWLSPARAGRNLILRAALAFGGYIIATVHLRVFDPRLLERGSLKRLLELRQR